MPKMTLFELIGLISGVLGIIGYFAMEKNQKRKSLLFLLLFSISFFAGGVFLPQKINPIIIQSENLTYADYVKTLNIFPIYTVGEKPIKFELEEGGCPEHEEQPNNSISRDFQVLLEGFFYRDKEFVNHERKDEDNYKRTMTPICRFDLGYSYEGLIICLFQDCGGSIISQKVLYIMDKFDGGKVVDRFPLAGDIWSSDGVGLGDYFSFIYNDEKPNASKYDASKGLKIISVSRHEWTEDTGYYENGETISKDTNFYHIITGRFLDIDGNFIEKWQIDAPKEYEYDLNQLKKRFNMSN